jgi:hypothetical protein
LASVLDASQSGARESAAGLYGGAALAAERTILRFVFGDRQVQQSLRFDPELERAAAAVDQSTGSDDSPAGFFDDLNGFLCRTSGRPDILDHKNVLILLEREPTAQSHGAAGVALGENGRHSPARGPLWFWQGPRDFLPDNHSAQSRRNNGSDDRVGKKSGQRVAKFLGEARILQDKRTLHISRAMQTAGKLKMAVPDGSGGLKHAQQFFS